MTRRDGGWGLLANWFESDVDQQKAEDTAMCLEWFAALEAADVADAWSRST